MNDSTPTVTAKSANYVPSSELFARLLSQENIGTRVDPYAKTASFNPVARELVLPSWQGFESAAWYLFIAHEVGHALFTPAQWMKNPAVDSMMKRHKVTIGQVHSVLNVLEDIRIERKIRAQYRGLGGFFSRGYAELVSRDFFKFGTKMSPERWAKYGILDHLNLYAKVGNLCNLSLTDPHQIAWYNRAVTLDTFDDLLILADEIIAFVKAKKEKSETANDHSQPSPEKSKDESPKSKDKPKDKGPKQDPKPEDKGDDQGSDGPGEDIEESDEEGEGSEPSGEELPESEAPKSPSPDSTEGEGDEEGDEEGEESEGSSGAEDLEGDEAEGESESKDGASGDEGESEDTDADSDADASKGDADGDDSTDSDEEGDSQTPGTENSPNMKPGTPSTEGAEDSLSSETQEAANQALDDAAQTYGKTRTIVPTDLAYLNDEDVDLKTVLAGWNASPAAKAIFLDAVIQHRREASPILASMVSTFRANQSATLHHRDQIAKSGVVDPIRLAGYRFTEDVFLRRTITQKGQSHGFVLNVDWSGSMGSKMPTMLWQILHMIWFAETIKVPVDVYAFSSTIPYNPKASHTHTGVGNICLYQSSASAALKTEALAYIMSLMYKFAAVTSNLNYTIAYGNANYDPSRPLIKYATASSLTASGRVLSTLPVASHSTVNKVFALSYLALAAALESTYGSLGYTPLFHAILSTIPVVRAFRERNRIEQCVSLWLTDGADTQGANVTDMKHGGINQYLSIRSTFFSPMTGKEYEAGDLLMPALVQFHKDATGASVVFVDLCSNPKDSLVRILDSTSIKELGDSILATDENGRTVVPYRYSRRSRYSRLGSSSRPAPKAKPLSNAKMRRTVIIKKSKGTFGLDGIVSIDGKDFPMGADAYIVADPAAFTEGSKYAQFAAKKILAKTEGVDSSITKTQESRILDAVNTTSAHLAMRRFTEILVPFLADSK